MSAGDGGMDDGDDEQTLADRLRSIRESIQRRQTAARADRRASARRVEREEPETVGERAQLKKQRAGEAADEAGALASDAVSLVSAELGVSESDAKGIIESGADVLDAAGDAGGSALDQLDVDGDGDTDILDAVENGGFEARGSQDAMAGEAPVGGVEDDIEPAGGIEDDLGLDEPIENQQDGGLF